MGSDRDRFSRPLLLLLGLLCLVVSEMFFKAFSTFQEYDDQGYVMITLKQYREGQPLYDAVFTQYGPAYYLFRNWLYVSLDVTHTLTGLVAVLHGVAVSGVLGLVAYRLTKSHLLALLTLALVPGRFNQFFNESGHPQEFLALLLALVMLAVTGSRREGLRACVLGMLVGAILMTKLNVGVFILVPVLLFFVVEIPQVWLRKALTGLLACGVVAFPAVLIRNHLQTAWGFSLATVLTGSLIPLVLVLRPSVAVPSWKNPIRFLAVLAGTVLAIVWHELARGTSVRGLWHGLLGQHLNFSAVFAKPFPVGAFFALFSVMALLVFCYWQWRRVPLRWAILACGLYGVGLCVVMVPPGARFMAMCFAPFAWLVPFSWNLRQSAGGCGAGGGRGGSGAAQAIQKTEPTTARYYSFLFLAAVFLILQAYPVAGSQISCGTILFPVVAVSALFEASRYWLGPAVAWPGVKIPTRVAVLLVCGLFGWKAARVAQLGYIYVHNEPTGLPGMALYRLPEPQARLLCWLAERLRPYTTFVTMPGLNSLYFLTGKEPPTTFNPTTWMTLLDAATQQRIIDRLTSQPTVGAVRNRAIAQEWAGALDISSRPLVRYFELEMKPVAQRDGYEVLEIRRP